MKRTLACLVVSVIVFSGCASYPSLRGMSDINAAVLKENLELVRQLSTGLDPSVEMPGEGSPLDHAYTHFVMQEGKIPKPEPAAILRLLLERCVEIYEKGVNCRKAMSYAVHPGYGDVVRALLAKGADPDEMLNEKVYTPLCGAALRGNDEIVKLLVEAGASIRRASECLMKLRVADTQGRPRLAADKYGAGAVAVIDKRAQDYAPALRMLDRYADAAAKRVLPEIEAAESAGDAALRSGRKDEALRHYVSVIARAPRGSPPDARLREKIIRLALSMDPRPALPEEAVRRSNRGQAYVKKAEDASGYGPAIEELEQAVIIAPWWAEGYFNLGLMQEKGKDYAGAMRNLKLYLAAVPKATDAALVKKKIDELEVSQELDSGGAPK